MDVIKALWITLIIVTGIIVASVLLMFIWPTLITIGIFFIVLMILKNKPPSP